MSENMIVTAIRGEIPQLEGKEFRDGMIEGFKKIASPLCLDYDENDEDRLFDRSMNHRKNGGYRVVCEFSNPKKYGIDYVLVKKSMIQPGENDKYHVTIDEFADIVDNMVEAGVERSSIHITSYIFYNGIDEPVKF